MLKTLLKELHSQATDEVEILTYADDGQVTTGRKRNDLVKQAKGQYVVFVDDDDMVAPTYIADILEAAEKNPDCITFNGWMETDGHNRTEFRLGLGYPYMTAIEANKNVYLRYPNHITPIKKSIATKVNFPNFTIGEDFIWATKIKELGLLKTQVKINKQLYYYLYRSIKP